MSKHNDMLFEVEQKTIAEGERFLAGAELSDSLPLERYSVLLEQYKRIYSQFRHIIRVSDRQQEQLNRLNERLGVANEMIRKIFGRYLSDEVVSEILESPNGVELGGEKRTITILMSDLRGFTAIADRMSPDEVVTMMSVYFEIVTDVIARYGGTIIDFIGDGILTVFGAPIARPDDALRAVACSLEMQASMEDVNRRNVACGFPETGMGIGITTGTVVVGNIGSRNKIKYGVVGSSVNFASRIESATVGGQILASVETIETCGPSLRIDNVFEVVLKGLSKPAILYQIGAIEGAYNVSLPRKEPLALPELVRPLQACFSLLNDTTIEKSVCKGLILRMSRVEAEVCTEEKVEKFANVKITLLSDGVEEIGALYAKVIDTKLNDKPGFRVHITSAPPHIYAFIEYALKKA